MNKSIYFLIIMFVLYLGLFLFSPAMFHNSLRFSINIFVKLIPILFLVFGIMVLTNKYVTPKSASKYLGKTAGAKKWIISILFGIVSTGSIYMWYPLLKELKSKGVSYGFIASFLYARAIKPAMIPLMIYYFGLKFTIVLTAVMVLFSFIQGVFIEEVMK